MSKDKDILLGMLRGGGSMTSGQQLKLSFIMSMPAILAQLSAVLMQFIDSAMPKPIVIFAKPFARSRLLAPRL